MISLKKNFILIAAFSSCCFFSTKILSKPVVQEYDRVLLDWGSVRIRFFGEAKVLETNGEDALRKAEDGAWQDGLMYISSAVKSICLEKKIIRGPEKDISAQVIAKKISSATYSSNTIFYGDGKVKVELESLMANIFKGTLEGFSEKPLPDVSTTKNSGIILKISGSAEPTGAYQIVDEKGKILFSSRDVAEEAYDKNLMGRWFQGSSSSELSYYVGAKPVSLEVKANGTSFEVSKKAWEAALDGNYPLSELEQQCILKGGDPLPYDLLEPADCNCSTDTSAGKKCIKWNYSVMENVGCCFNWLQPTRTPSPTATLTPTWTPSPSITWMPSPTVTWRPSPTWTPSPSITWMPSPTVTWRPSPTTTWTPSPSITWMPSPTVTWRPSPTVTLK